ncbi:MAG: PfkB family carbohydrate kinase [Candidatus Sumerlaeia bacterium]|nr:PfkB family carbohydrate kinase [Candidatus Sumerlaeia bacterium]
MKPVVGIGIACLDHLIVVPEGAETRGRVTHVNNYLMEGGGLTATALAAAARLGAPARLWTCLGDDEPGQAILHSLVRAGIDIRGIHIVRGARSPLSIIHVASPSGERTIYHFRGDVFARAGTPPQFDGIEEAGALLVDATWHDGALAGAKRAREIGIPVVGDFDPRRDPELAALLDCLIVGEKVGDDLARGQGVEVALYRLRSFGPPWVALTAGEKGCWYLSGEEIRHCPAYPVHVVDTTGAGDAFHGAFAFALAQDWDIEKAVRLGSAVGALCCRALGGRAGLPDLPTALTLMGEA